MTDNNKKLGLYNKYEVKRLYDVDEKHTYCDYFVLDLDHDKFALPAMEAYATACEKEYPELAKDIRNQIHSISMVRGFAT